LLKKIALPILIIGLAVLAFMLLKVSEPETPAMEKKEKAWLVEAVQVNYQRVAPEVTLYGRVETPRDASLKSALEADVIEVNVLEGDRVTAGQTLLKLDDIDIQLLLQQRQADLQEAQAQIDGENQRFQRDKALLANQKQLLDLADKAVQRARKLEQTRLASQASLDDALAAYEQQALALKQLQFDIDNHTVRLAQLQAARQRAEALLAQAEVNLRRTEIKAPFDSRVAELTVALGDRVRPGDTLLTVYDLDNLEVRAQVPGRYVPQVRQMLQQGKQLEASAEVDGQLMRLTLNRLSGEVREDSGGIDGLFRIENNMAPLPLGTFVELQLQLAEQENVIEVPFSALYGMDRVYRIEEGHLQSVPIQRVGEVERENGKNSLLIRSEALKPDDLIAATQLPNAITGLRVEVAD